MTVPYFLDSAQITFDNMQDDAVTDVNTIISSVRTLLVTNLGWSEPSTALFKTPVDAASRFLDVLLTRISATNLEVRVRNASAATVITRRIQLTSGASVWYHGNIFGVVIACLNTTNEIAQAHILDQTPDLQSDSALYVIANALRTTADSNDANGSVTGQYYAIDNGAAAILSRLRRWTASGNSNGGSTVEAAFRTIIGTLRYRDALCAINSAGTLKWAGRICHALMVDESVGSNMRRNPYIDSSTGAEFLSLGLSATASHMKLAFRSDH